jgi:hypothetical protein
MESGIKFNRNKFLKSSLACPHQTYNNKNSAVLEAQVLKIMAAELSLIIEIQASCPKIQVKSKTRKIPSLVRGIIGLVVQLRSRKKLRIKKISAHRAS